MITIRRNLTQEIILAALSCMIRRHPFLCAVVELKPDSQACLVGKPFRSIDLIDFHSGKKSDWIRWYHDTDEKLYNLREGPLFRLGVFDSAEPDSTDVVFMGHHLIGDGMAFVNLAMSFHDALCKTLPESPVIPPVIGLTGSLKTRPKSGIMSRYMAGKLNRIWEKNKRIFREEEFTAFRNDYRAANPSGILFHEIDNELYQVLLAKSRDTNVTVNELISCALVYSVQKNRNTHNGQVELGIAINIRNEVMPDARHCLGNYVSGVIVRWTYNTLISTEANLQLFKKAIRKKVLHSQKRYAPILFYMKLNPDFVDSIYPAEYGSYPNKASKQLANILGERRNYKNVGISNLGKLGWTSETEYPIERMVFIPPGYPANSLNLGIVTYNQKMQICIRYNQRLLKTETVKNVLSDIISFLR